MEEILAQIAGNLGIIGLALVVMCFILSAILGAIISK